MATVGLIPKSSDVCQIRFHRTAQNVARQFLRNPIERLKTQKRGGKAKAFPPLFSKPLNYFRFELTLLNVLLILVPSWLMAEMAATAIRAAIRPYSIAVAPLEFLIILRKNFISGLLGFNLHLPG